MPLVPRAALVVVGVLLPLVVVSPVGVFTVRVVLVVRVPRGPVGIAGTRVMSAPFPSVGGRDADVDWLRL